VTPTRDVVEGERDLRVKIRLATADDARAIHDIYAPIVRGTTISFEWEPPTVDEMASRIERTLSDGYPWLIAAIDGEIAGYAYAGRFRARAAYDWATETSVYVHPDHHRAGVGRTTYHALLRLLERQGYRSAYGVMTLPNAASEALHRAVGFAEVGRFPRVGWKFGAWHDVAVWCAPLGDVSPAPGPIRTLASVLDETS
jgi:L-amino acid N-acyltransferase YncA